MVDIKPTEIDQIDKAFDIDDLNKAVKAIETGTMTAAGPIPPIPPDIKIGIIPFQSNPQVKEVKTKEESLNYVPKYDLDPTNNTREVFSHFIYKEEVKPASYTLQENEQLVKINPDNSLTVNIPQKQIIDIVTFEPTLEIKDESSYTVYLLRQQSSKSEFNLDLTTLGTATIETYEQFKLNVLRTISKDYLKITKNKHDPSFVKIELTNLCSFVEKYLQNEPLGRDKRHLIELLKNIKVELVSHKSFFWDRIQKYVETPESNIPPAPYLTPEISYWLQRVRDFISFRYAPYLAKDPLTNTYPMCPNINLYLSDVEAIVGDLEILLRDLYYKHKALLFKTQKKENIKDATIFDNVNTGEEGSENTQRGESRMIAKDIELD
ncbi:6043_t:CDS:2, partial [Racocetra persica]